MNISAYSRQVLTLGIMGAIILSVAVAGWLLRAQIPTAQIFPDVPLNHPAARAIANVYARGIIQGNPDGTFRPNESVSRDALVKMVIAATTSDTDRAQCLADLGAESLFLDVDATAWIRPYLCLAKKLGVVTGYADHTFRGGQPVMFIDASAIVIRGFHIAVVPNAQAWYAPYVDAIQAHGALPDSILYFDQLLTRAEIAQMIAAMLTTTAPQQSAPAPTLRVIPQAPALPLVPSTPILPAPPTLAPLPVPTLPTTLPSLSPLPEGGTNEQVSPGQAPPGFSIPSLPLLPPL